MRILTKSLLPSFILAIAIFIVGSFVFSTLDVSKWNVAFKVFVGIIWLGGSYVMSVIIYEENKEIK